MKLSAQYRRDRAKERFSIMGLPTWAKSKGLKPPFTPGTADAYAAYKARKEVEAKALGL